MQRFRQLSCAPRALFTTALGSLLILLGGCDMANQQSDGVTVTTQFSRSYAIKEGTTVELNSLNVGQVSRVDTQDQATHIVIALDTDKSGVVQQNSAVAYNNLRDRVIIYNSANASESVADGDSLQSLNSPLEEAAWQAGRALGMVQDSVRHATDSFNSYFESEEWKNTRQRVEDDLRAFADQSRQAVDDIGKDIDVFMRDLESESRGAVDAAKEQLKTLEDELRKLSETGQKDATERMERLLESLRTALDGRRNNDQ